MAKKPNLKTSSCMVKIFIAESEPGVAVMGTPAASHQTRIALAKQVAKGGSNQAGKESKMVNAKNELTSQSGENEEVAYTPEKVEKLEADEYLLEKALKAQENAFERMRKQHLMRLAQERATSHNELRKTRKKERQNRKGGRK